VHEEEDGMRLGPWQLFRILRQSLGFRGRSHGVDPSPKRRALVGTESAQVSSDELTLRENPTRICGITSETIGKLKFILVGMLLGLIHPVTCLGDHGLHGI
jgi:hypothetical protein